MTSLSFDDIDRARKILELEEEATLREIKVAYRNLSKKWHPDKCKKKDQNICHEKMKEINSAYEVVLRFVDGYCYSFTKQKTPDDDQREFWMSRFGKDPTWGLGWES
ncbi:hypothetical protein A2291_08680 [candidate division WOR-1 bacterium RIFOXYB2_FULL_42_35]|uniref:J domain-containing protein n=1 Tax=candidate division WOR-1 bacterium RIFOXYC2_FULL_41_25 TaxID=1802586 RepID=A0A1F4TMB8_UNCSA|nr:MAG: hypothetical protein A2291_08680 [candidate division WOR-1 bacterium RIFOXYB2_FULL_42_35]OGC23078.1 MAG: hypothetical protein A2247_08580 [candidate division WOR-1 bacterium RIFOXYA2_FULL_41_14]OGC33650.1 MAG: hypothetical protein A2462_02270 [candidate division WOR-1 bacterium RIFOXYC2_FULL_41_25]OGC43613.1 MAG: hypothetical protein A2548_02360 [candidate division WOR-1 bacterium RIFOXYD2_FULL_41_8]